MATNLKESTDNHLVTIDKSFVEFAQKRVISHCGGKLIKSGSGEVQSQTDQGNAQGSNTEGKD